MGCNSSNKICVYFWGYNRLYIKNNYLNVIHSMKNIIFTMLSFLSSSKFPPNTPIKDVKRMKATNHMSSSKFYIVFTSVVILAFFYFASLAIMFIMPQQPDFITGFVTIFSKTIEVLAIIIASYVGAQAVVDLKYGSDSSVTLEAVNETSSDVTVIQTNVKEDDYELL
jgi:hypothetical protein